MKLSIVIPCYNEEKGVLNLKQKLDSVLHSLAEDYDVELIFVDDGSTDKTHQLLTEAFGSLGYLKIIRHAINRNLGAAMRTGFEHATGDVIATLDSDCTYNPE